MANAELKGVNVGNTPYNFKDEVARNKIDDVNSAHQQLLKDTVGWIGKNLLVQNDTTTRTYDGVTCTYDPSDCGWTLNGTATDNIVFILYGWESPIPSRWIGRELKAVLKNKIQGVSLNGNAKDSSGNIVAYFDHPSFEITQEVVTANVFIWVVSGTVFDNLKVYPMICDANLPDEPFEKPHESVEVMFEEEIHGVNLFEHHTVSQVKSGVTFTSNNDGTITANGTCDVYDLIGDGTRYHLQPGRYIVSFVDDPTDNEIISDVGWAYGFHIRFYNSSNQEVAAVHQYERKEVEFEYLESYDNYDWFIHISTTAVFNNKVFKPMIRRADIDDPTYRQYNHQSIQNQLNAQTGVLGAKNLLEHTATSQVHYDRTYTVNADRTITVNGVHANEDVNFVIWQRDVSYYGSVLDSDKYYILSSGVNSNGSDCTMYYGEMVDGSWVYHNIRNGSDYEVFKPNPNRTLEQVTIWTHRDYTCNNLTFKPMIRLASDPDDTYVPYAMTNRELTDKKLEIISSTTDIGEGAALADNVLYAVLEG